MAYSLHLIVQVGYVIFELKKTQWLIFEVLSLSWWYYFMED